MRSTIPLLLAVFITSTLSGCLTQDQGDVVMPSSTIDSSFNNQTANLSWNFTIQRTLSYYAGVQAGGLRAMAPQDGYCRMMTFTVPPGATLMDVTYIINPYNTTNPSFGLIGITARSESFEQWDAAPDEFNPNESYFDTVRQFTIQNPIPGPWRIYISAVGPAFDIEGNMTMMLEGRSPKPPSSLQTEFVGSFNEPCTPKS